MSNELIAQLLAIPGAVGAVVYLAKRAIEIMLDQDRKIRKMEQDHILGKISDLESRLQHVNIVIQDKLIPELDRARDTMTRNAVRLDALGDSLQKHGSIIELALPQIRAEIGKLSMYWKQTKEQK